MSKSLLLLFLSLNFAISTFAQVGGSSSYEFLNLPSSARTAALGGDLISVKDNDLSLGIVNPALLNKLMDNSLVMTYLNYFSDINSGFVGFSKNYEDKGSFSLGMQYMNYGRFTRADPNGEITGEFSAGDYALNFGWGRGFGKHLSYGTNVKLLYSALESYQSFGMALDLAGTYFNEEDGFGAAILAKNIGTQIVAYRKGNTEPLPTEMKIEVSKKLSHAPFRFSLAFDNMQRLRMVPKDTTSNFNTVTGDEQTKSPGFFGNTLRHLVAGVEIMPTKSFSVRFGYNVQRSQELKVASKPGTIGLSWGFGFRISKFHLSYARAAYHLAGASNHFTITTNISSFSRN
ncbi:MAG: type IX secretion system protein PorQ [Bacteroidetes bacterium]|nr:type IX secretion system protein PorQ [Bacteroidota bacterium]HET6244257.1 type IX secretion system protein PorQ [Bacteroidia bacterium]